jgi:hypothetical protein
MALLHAGSLLDFEPGSRDVMFLRNVGWLTRPQGATSQRKNSLLPPLWELQMQHKMKSQNFFIKGTKLILIFFILYRYINCIFLPNRIWLMIVNDKLRKLWKENTVAYFKPSYIFPAGKLWIYIYKENYFLECDAVYSGINSSTLRRKLLPQSVFTGCWLGLFINLKDWGSKFFRNFVHFLPGYTLITSQKTVFYVSNQIG